MEENNLDLLTAEPLNLTDEEKLESERQNASDHYAIIEARTQRAHALLEAVEKLDAKAENTIDWMWGLRSATHFTKGSRVKAAAHIWHNGVFPELRAENSIDAIIQLAAKIPSQGEG